MTAVAVCLFVGSVLAAPARTELTDEEITKKLVGKWDETLEQEGVKGKVTLEYKKDGVLEAEGTLEIGGKEVKIKVTCKWKVEKGELIETIEKAEPEGLIPAGTVTKDKVLSIDDKTCTYKDEMGKEHTKTRKN